MSKKKQFVWQPRLLIIYSVTLTSIMSVSVIAPALPKMASALQITHDKIGWLVTSYTIPGMVLAMFVGIFTDKFGRKTVLIPCLLLFGIAGGSCFFVRNFYGLLFLRFAQGIGGAALASLSAVIIGDLYKGDDRIKVMGMNASILSVGTGSFPFIGGSMALIAWNYPFLIYFVGVIIGFIALFSLKVPAVQEQSNFKQYIFEAFSYLKSVKALLLYLMGIISFIVLYGGILTYFSVLMSERFQISSFIIGFFLSLMSFVTAFVSSQVGKLAQKFKRDYLIQIGYVLYGIALFIFPWITNPYWMILPIVIFGIGHGLNIPFLQTMSTELAPAAYRGIAVTLFGTMLRTGQTIGPLFMGAILSIGDMNAMYITAAFVAWLPAVLLIRFGRLLKREG